MLIKAVRILALLTLVFVACFWVSHQFAWLMVVMVGFNLFFSPLVPLTDALANTWQKQITMDYGRVRLWGSIAFVIGSALVGKLVSIYDYRAILALLSIGIASMLLGMLLRPSVMPQGKSRHQESAGWPAWRSLVAQSWRFRPASVCCRARTRRTMVSAPSTGRGQDTPHLQWVTCGRLVWSLK